ncbi:MAG TPA: hypothetical protein VIJ33_03505 [Solirubrobacteraceae bacterium]
MNATADLQAHTMSSGSRVTTTYTRADLGIATALVTGTPGGQWEARLYYGPEPDEHDTETVDSKPAAERLAIGHSLIF